MPGAASTSRSLTGSQRYRCEPDLVVPKPDQEHERGFARPVPVSGTGWVTRLRARTPRPADFLALLAVLLFGGTYLASAGFLDRYWVPLLPFLIIGGLAGLREARAWRLGLVLIPLALGAGYGLAAHHDDWAALKAHWQAGRALLAAGVPPTQIENGYPWNGYYLYDQSIAGLPSHDVTVIGRDFAPLRIIDPLYIIAPAPRLGYQVVSTVPYWAWLQGGVQREMLVLRRE